MTVYPGIPAESTPEQEFLRVAMLGACSPDSLLPNEIELAERVIGAWAQRFLLVREHQPETPYWIDVTSGQPPVRIARQPQPGPGIRFFGAGPAFTELDALIQQIRNTREFLPSLGVGETTTPEAALAILEHLDSCWSPKLTERRHARHRVKSRLTIAWGFDGILEVLQPGDSLSFDGSTYESWIVENVSAGGFGALVPQVRGDWLRIGCLLAMQPEGGDNWLIQAKFEEMNKLVPMEMLENSVGVMPMVHHPDFRAAGFVEKYRQKKGADRDPPREVSLTYGAMRILARAMELSGTVTDARAIRARADEAAATLPDEFKPSELLGVDPDGHLRQTTVAAHVVGGKFLPLRLGATD